MMCIIISDTQRLRSKRTKRLENELVLLSGGGSVVNVRLSNMNINHHHGNHSHASVGGGVQQQQQGRQHGPAVVHNAMYDVSHDESYDAAALTTTSTTASKVKLTPNILYTAGAKDASILTNSTYEGLQSSHSAVPNSVYEGLASNA